MASDEVPEGWVRLNVGGRVFVAMKHTLRVSPFFVRLFETDARMPDATAGSSTHFIDRNPDRFTKVLDYLRDGTLFEDNNCNHEGTVMDLKLLDRYADAAYLRHDEAFFARLFETDDRMPDATDGSSTHFVDRNAHRFSTILDYLRDGTFFADKNCNLDELRLEADFYGLDDLVRIIDEAKAQNELCSTTKCVVVSRKNHGGGGKRVEIAVAPRDEEHFLLRHLQQHYPCRVGAPSLQFPYGFTFELRACNTCSNCTIRYEYGYDFYCTQNRNFKQPHGCVCAPGTADAMLKDVLSTLESHGYVMDRNVDATFAAAGKVATSWTFVM